MVASIETMITNLEEGKDAMIVKLGGGYGFQRNLRTRGIMEGKIVKVVTRHPFGGPLVLEVDGNKTTIGRGMARRIIVKEAV